MANGSTPSSAGDNWRLDKLVGAVTSGGTGIGGMASSARWGVLRLERRRINRLDAVVDPPAFPPDLTVVWQADSAFDLRAARIALREALTEWREAERRVSAAADPGAFAVAQVEVSVLRAAYQRRFEAVRSSLHEA
jgi:hypothetical protein